jgi:hypothetical protein
MVAAKPVVLTQAASNPSKYAPQPLVVVGDIPQTAVAAFVAVDATPADATAVATDLIAVRAALIAAGLMAAS